MTTTAELCALTQLQLRQEEERAAKLASEVEVLKSKVQHIDGLMARAFDVSPNDLARQQLGADAMWHQHLVRQRAELMTALASLRAQQEVQRVDLANAFGRNEAMTELAAKDRKKARQKAMRKRLEKLDELVLTEAMALRSLP